MAMIIKNKFGDESFDFDALSPEIIREAVRRGLRSKLEDSYASAKQNNWGDDDKARIKSETAERIRNGEWNGEGGGRTSDPIAAEAKAIVTKMLAAKGIKPGETDDEKAEFKARVKAGMANPKIVEMAKAAVAARLAAADDIEI